jgi:hypothetical protein
MVLIPIVGVSNSGIHPSGLISLEALEGLVVYNQ